MRGLVDFVLPTGCVACRSWIPPVDTEGEPRSIVCEACTTRLARASWPRCPRCHAPRGTGRADAADCLDCRDWPPELTRARYAHVLAPPATDLVHALKYEGWRELADPMGAAMAETAARQVEGLGPARSTPTEAGARSTVAEAGARPTGPARWIVVPVPTTAERIARRGYNQAGLLADAVARRLRLPVWTVLERRAAPRSQTALSPAERRENVRGAFDARESLARRSAGAHVLLVDDVLTTGATAGEAARTLASLGVGSVSLVTFARALPRGEE